MEEKGKIRAIIFSSRQVKEEKYKKEELYTMKASDMLLVGYDYDAWYGYSEKVPICIDASTKNNSQTLICGMSGSGKSYLTNQYLTRICLHGGADSKVYFADFKQDDSFSHLRKCHRYFSYDKTLDALDEVYEIMHKELFEKFLSKHGQYHRWYPIFTIMLWTGMRVGEITGLRWCDIDLEEEVINVNHTLVYCCTKTEAGQIFAINTTKTKAGERTIPMLPIVKEAFLIEKEYQEECGIKSEAVVDGYRDFIFVNRFGNVQHQGTLNKALRRIIRDCNFEVLDKDHRDNAVILPKFSNHSLRHTFTTRMCEAGVNIKAMQDILGHADAETTMQIYAEATKDLKKSELINFEEYFDRLKDAQKKGEM